MEPFVLVLVLLVLAAAVVLVWRTYASRKETTTLRPPSDILGDAHKPEIDQLKQVQNGDIILRGDEQWFVRGRIELDEAGWGWVEHLLDEGSQRQWLSVEDEEQFTLTLWRSLPAGEIESGAAGDRTVVARGVAYTLQEKGTATFTASGATATAPSGSMQYADYASKDGDLLGFENFGGSWEASLGESIQPWELTVLPSTERKGHL